MENLVGVKTGYLTVESYLCSKKTKSGSVNLWVLRCVCGNTTIQCTADINRKKAESCGCKKYDFISQKNQKDLTGQRFGRLFVMQRDKKQTTGGTYFYKCLCDCGNEKIINGGSLRHGNTKSCGCLKIEMNMKEIERNNTTRRGNYHNKRLSADNQKKHKEWRNKVKSRDNNICQICGLKSIGGMCAHHIKEWSIYPELQTDISNGVTLCRKCHYKVHANKMDFVFVV